MSEEELARYGITPEEYHRFAEAEQEWSRKQAQAADPHALMQDHRALLCDSHFVSHIKMYARGALMHAQMMSAISMARAQLPKGVVHHSRATDWTDTCPLSTLELEEFDLTREQCEALADSQFCGDARRHRHGATSRAQFVMQIDDARNRSRSRQIDAHVRVCGMWDTKPGKHGPVAQLAGAFYDAGMSLRETSERLRKVAGGKPLSAQQIAAVKDELRAHAASRQHWATIHQQREQR